MPNLLNDYRSTGNDDRPKQAEFLCNSAALVQIAALSSAGILTRSIRNGGWHRASGTAGNAYSWTLDHFQSSDRFNSPRRRGRGKGDSLFQ